MLKYLILSCFVAGLTCNSAYGASQSKTSNTPANCKRIFKGAEASSTIIDSHGVEVTGDINLGHIDTLTAKRANDFFFSSATFRLVLSPGRIKVSDDCSMSTCVRVKAVPPRCPGTSEYLISFSVIPTKFGAGDFSTEAKLPLEDPKAEYDLELDALSNRKVLGSISIPWLTVGKDPTDVESIKKFTSNQSNELVLQVLNSGDRPIQLGAWDKDVRSFAGLRLTESSCAQKALAPKEACKIKITKPPGKLPLPMSAWWTNFSKDESNAFTLSLRSDKELNLSVDIQNR